MSYASFKLERSISSLSIVLARIHTVVRNDVTSLERVKRKNHQMIKITAKFCWF